MRIVEFRAENFKKLKVVQIRPTENLIQITGRNGSGKSSCLDAIMAALAGTANIPSKPVRKGTGKAVVTLDLGDITVTRKFTESGGTSLIVEAKNGSRYPSPQTMLDELLGKLTFDPLAFTRMDAKSQLNTLRGMVDLGGVDIDELDKLNKLDYDHRTLINRQSKAVAAQRDAIHIPVGMPDAPVDISELIAQLQSVSKHNSEIETLQREVIDTRKAISQLQADAASNRERAMKLLEEADAHEASAAELIAELASQPPIPDLLNSDDLALAIEQARDINEQFELVNRRAALNKQCREFETESMNLTQAIVDREQAKADAITNAEMPLDGLSFGDGEVIYNGLPLDQASDAEQLRISVAIAMAANPTLRVLRIKDGSLLDDDSLALIEEMADGNDYQVWIEAVDTSGTVGIVMEDGLVKAVNA